MKKTSVFYTIIALSILLSGIAYANDYSTGEKNLVEAKQQVQEIKQEKKELKNNTQAKAEKKMAEQNKKVTAEFEKSIQNIKDLVARIESRMTKMELEGMKVSASRSILEIAKIKISIAETELANLEKMILEVGQTSSTSTDQIKLRKNTLNGVKLQSEKVKNSIKTAHRYTVGVVESLKPGFIKEKVSTSTVITETSTTTNN